MTCCPVETTASCIVSTIYAVCAVVLLWYVCTKRVATTHDGTNPAKLGLGDNVTSHNTRFTKSLLQLVNIQNTGYTGIISAFTQILIMTMHDMINFDYDYIRIGIVSMIMITNKT